VSVRFATFNVENFFARPKVFSLPDWADGQPVLVRPRQGWHLCSSTAPASCPTE
jgi:hypothetical protein